MGFWQQPRGRCEAFASAPGLAPRVLGSGSVVVLWSPRAGTSCPLARSEERSDSVCSPAPRGVFRVGESCSLLILRIKCRSSSGQKPSEQGQPFQEQLRLLGD